MEETRGTSGKSMFVDVEMSIFEYALPSGLIPLVDPFLIPHNYVDLFVLIVWFCMNVFAYIGQERGTRRPI